MTLSTAFNPSTALGIPGGVFYPDGNTGVDLQDAIDAAVANNGGVVDVRHLRGIDVRSTVTLDPTQVSLIGAGTVFDTTLGGTLGGSNVGLLVQPGSNARPRGQASHTIFGMRFDGTGSGGSQKAVVFQGNGTNPDARGNMSNCFIEDYNIGVQILNNAYVNKFNVVDIRGCAYAARSESGGTNRGECISWVNCTLGNGNTIWAAGHSIDWMFTGCSFDFPGGAFIYTDDKVYCVNCHFEDSASTNKNWFQVDNNGHIYLTQCNIGFASGTYSGNTIFKQWGQGGKFRLYSCNGNVPSSGVTVTNAGSDFFSDTGSSTAPFWS